MPGILSDMFAGGDESSEQHAQDEHAETNSDAHFAPSVELGVSASGDHPNADGSSSHWSSDTDVAASADIDATLGAAADLTTMQGEA